MDADTAERWPGGPALRRAAELVWAAVDADGAGSPRQVPGWASTLPRTRRGTCFRTRFRSTGRCRSGMNPAGLLRSAEQLLRRVATPGAGIGLHALRTQVADLVWEANTGVGG